MREDSELVQLAVGGDQSAFAELYERYFDNVYDFLARMVHNREEAADLAQDTFLRAMNSLSSLAKGGSFKSWLFTIARNTALNRIERTSRLQPLEQQTAEGDEVELQVIDPGRFGNPEEAAEASAYAALVWEAAASLDQRTYSVLDLSVRQNLNSEELAEVLGVTRNNAYVMVNRMKSALESAIGSLVLLRNGRRECAELNAALEKLQVSEMTPAARRVIDRHAARCETCSEQRRKLASPFAIFAGFGLAYPASGVKAAIFENVAAGFSQTYGGAGAASSAVGAPASGGVMPGVAPMVGGGFGGGGAAPPLPPVGEMQGGGWGKWKIVLAAAGVGALLLLGGSLYSFGFGNGDEDPPSQALVVASPTSSATAAPSASPTATLTPLPSATQQPQAAPPQPTQPPLQTPPTATPTATVPPVVTSTPTNCTVSVIASAAILNFEDDQSSLPLTLSSETTCGADIEFSLTPSESWIVPIPNAGTIPANGSLNVTVRILRNQLKPSKYSGEILLESIGRELVIDVLVEIVPPTPTPTPTRVRGFIN